MNPAARIKELARKTGFDAVRIARWDAVLNQQFLLEQWLASGHAGEMGYLSRHPEDRCNPRSLHEQCNSVIVCALSYFSPSPRSGTEDQPCVSRYAWGDDYHGVLGDKLNLLAGRINSKVAEHTWKPTVDTSPILEKAFGEASGIGWRGKHSLIINPELGSWFFIGLLLTSLELEPDEPWGDECEDCRACLDTCPTGALVAPRVLAADKCISYLNTETRQPAASGVDLYGWLYGCDLCQTACPYNSGAGNTSEPRFIPARGIENLHPSEVIEMDEAAFVSRFDGTVIRRRNLWRLQAQAHCLDESDANLSV